MHLVGFIYTLQYDARYIQRQILTALSLSFAAAAAAAAAADDDERLDSLQSCYQPSLAASS